MPSVSITLAACRQLETLLAAALPSTVTITRRLNQSYPEGERVSILPGTATMETETAFLGSATTAIRNDNLTIVTWIEVIFGGDQTDAEDLAHAHDATIQTVAANNPTLNDLPGVLAFGARCTRTEYPCVEIRPGFHYLWIEREWTLETRLDAP